MTKSADTFEDAITRFRNRSIHTYVGHSLTFRGQILQNGEFGVQSGWDTATNEFILEHLLRLDYLRRKVTHNPQKTDIKTLEERARDLSISLPKDVNETSPAGEEVARPAGARVRFALRPGRFRSKHSAAARHQPAQCRRPNVRRRRSISTSSSRPGSTAGSRPIGSRRASR